jgi:2-isopropylmalate synthase
MIDTASDRQIRIFDTTLRDGEQAPGCSMTLREKFRVAKALSELNVDVIEAGFPAASPGDFESVKAIADANLGPIICGLARCNASDIEKVHAAVKGADRHRIHVFVATSKIHRDHKLKMAKEEIIKSAVGAISMAFLSRRGCYRRNRGWRDHREYSGYGRLHSTRGIRQLISLPDVPCARHR